MAEQTVEAGTVAVVLVNVIDDDGHHVAATIDTTTTRLQKGDTTDTTWNSVVPTVDTIATGVYRIEFSSLSPAIVVDDNDELIRVKINGTISGTAWTEYHMPLKVLTAGGGGGGGDATAANQTTIINHLTDVKGTSFVKDTHSLTDITADVTGLNGDAMRGTNSAFLAASAPSNFSSLAINASGHVSRVTLTDTTTTNTDMRGTDNALLAASAPTNFGDLAITASTGRVTVGTNADKTGYSISGSITTLDGLNDPTAAAIADAVLDESLAAHNTGGTLGKAIRQIKEGVVSAESTVNDASATTTSFVTALTSAVDDFYNDKILVFIGGALTGQARIISDYNGTTKAVTFDEATTSAPANGDGFIILGIHSHPITQIKQEVRTEMDSNSTQLAAIVADTNELQGDWVNGGRLDLILDSVLSLLDDARSEPGQGAPPVNPDAMTKLDYLYKAWRNKKTQTATTFSLFDDAGTTVDHKATVSDDGTTATIGEVATGP